MFHILLRKKCYNAYLLYPDGVKRKISFRVRGRNNWHWHHNKPSLRLKLNKKYTIDLHDISIYKSEDKLMISNPYGEILSKEFDLLSNSTEFVNVFINNEFVGLYHLLKANESFLRNNNICNNAIYTGDKCVY